VPEKGVDDGMHLLMMETCELMYEKPASSQGVTETAALVEEKVFLHDN
jgi:hypothetical protein